MAGNNGETFTIDYIILIHLQLRKYSFISRCVEIVYVAEPRAEVLLRVLVGNTDFEQKLEALSSPGNDKLAIENAGILGSVRFTNIVSKWPVVEAAEPFSSYYLLCQWDPFNIWGLAEVHLKLPVSKHVSTITAIAL